MSTIKYILFDAANTLIHKPSLWDNFANVLKVEGYDVSIKELKNKHKLLSEFIKFPDVTSQEFYSTFNKELLHALGIIETPQLLEQIFSACKYLPWEVFEDTKYLSKLERYELGVLSNFNSNLRTLLKDKLPDINFKHIIISEEEGVSKPNIEFFECAIQKIGLKPNEILYIGDSLKLDVIPALQLGFQVKLIDRDDAYPMSNYSIATLKECIQNKTRE
ncbi:HAD family hydrolase [Psychroserpens ponticola]|uniref:HAD family hydrolase n=1 Tax=Psychroserpens ponticola TaxID=2932268 RepID=A0ABY7S059_9FLAO|nr:HAD family hydrolase [Psychroserpens ponticola]WCO02518.1 HAD family hydrolase [Psychroserpens ponticola]